MKRKGWIIDQICDMENLRLAYWKACRGKRLKSDVINFCKPSLDFNLLKLSKKMREGKLDFSGYKKFLIHDPKERLISAPSFEHVVMQHAIMNICNEDFEKKQIYDSYACRVGKGTYAALERARLCQSKYKYCMKLDVRKYFDSIDHAILLKMLNRIYKDPFLIRLFELIIEGYSVNPGKGLPIGSLTSQYFANHYLSYADHYAKEVLKAKAYVRYMDDIMIWDNDIAPLRQIGFKFRIFLESQLNLSLKVMKTNPTNRFMTFLGYRISAFEIRLSSRSGKRYINHIRYLFEAFNDGIISEEEINRKLQPILAFAYKANSKNVRSKAMNQCI